VYIKWYCLWFCVCRMHNLPNIVVEFLTLLLRIWKIPGTLVGPDDQLPWLRFSWFFSFPPGEFRFFSPEDRVGLLPKRGCLLTLTYYAFPRWYEFGERRWNDILTGQNRITRRKTCPSAILFTTNPAWIDPGANLDLRGERPATNYLSHGTAHKFRVITLKLGHDRFVQNTFQLIIHLSPYHQRYIV
jgi:hypothetical protein